MMVGLKNTLKAYGQRITYLSFVYTKMGISWKILCLNKDSFNRKYYYQKSTFKLEYNTISWLKK